LNQGSKKGAVTATPRSLNGEFEKIQNSWVLKRKVVN
jgi:hypothetical protein